MRAAWSGMSCFCWALVVALALLMTTVLLRVDEGGAGQRGLKDQAEDEVASDRPGPP